jgi:glycine cleavage system aminomethyltransferase T
VVIGDKVVVEGRSVGEITSIASHPELGEIALAVLKKNAFDPGTRVNIGDTDGIVLPSKRDF